MAPSKETPENKVTTVSSFVGEIDDQTTHLSPWQQPVRQSPVWVNWNASNRGRPRSN